MVCRITWMDAGIVAATPRPTLFSWSVTPPGYLSISILPKVTFGACSGATMDDLTYHQLSPGIPNPHLPFTNIGRPQIAIMTISGNDVGFEVALNDCIMQVWRPKDCNTTLDSIEASIRAPNFKEKVVKTQDHFTRRYVEFFNDIETGCDNVSRAFWSDKTSSSDETGALAVPKPRFFPYQRLEIFFWCRLAKSMAIKLLIKSIDIKNSKILSMVASLRTTRDGEPWTWSPFFDDKESFYDGLTKMLSGRDSSAFPLPEQMRRIFHPKGSGYTAYICECVSRGN
ncbi:hypothetical protein V8E54_003843 [Elaphomyces granulatus]